jgi:hypothetical protein
LIATADATPVSLTLPPDATLVSPVWDAEATPVSHGEDQQAAKPISDAMREQLAREDALGDKADKVALQAATLVPLHE